MQIDGNEMKYYFADIAKYERMPKIVYHYCSLQAFYDIIANSTIRLTNITKSNDQDEIRYVKPFIEKALLISVQEYNAYASPEFKITNDSIEEIVEAHFNELSKTFYVACFSEVVNLIDQWARYADHAKGIAIGFSTNTFVKLQTTPYTGYVFSGIVYDANYVIQRIIKVVTDECEKRFIPNDEAYNFSIIIDVIRKLVTTLLRHAPLYKNPAFSQEKEWRLIYNPFGRITSIPDKFIYFDRLNESNTYRTSDKITRHEIQYKIIDDGRQLTSYVDINFDLIKRELIREIIIGNQSKLNPSDMDLISFLKNRGYNISNVGLHDTLTISKSTIPYNK